MDARYQDSDLVLGTLQQDPLALKELTVMDSVIQGPLLCVCVCVCVCVRVCRHVLCVDSGAEHCDRSMEKW